jgi:hypothetical protein
MSKTPYFRLLLRFCGIGLLLFAGLQFVRPELRNPPVTAEIQAPAAEVKAIFKHSCYNCHSNETELAWFDRVVPAYWIVSRDVHRAKAHLNFSEIGALSEQLQSGQDHGTYLYAMYRGSPLRKLVSTEEKSPTGRAAYILGQRAAVMT